VRPSDHADYGLWHARLGHFGRNKIIGPLRYRGYTFRPGSDRCECAASRLNRRRKGHPSQPTNRRVYTHFGERVASDLCGPFKLLPFSIHKFKFAINFVDYFSGVIAVYFLENGSSPEIVSAVRAFLRDYAHLLTDTRNPGVMDEWLTDRHSHHCTAAHERPQLHCSTLKLRSLPLLSQLCAVQRASSAAPGRPVARPGGCGTEARRASASRIGGHVSRSRERAVQRGSVAHAFP